MAASTRIPPELFRNILAYMEDKHDLVRYYELRTAWARTLQHLSSLSSVCVHWANFIRPRMFEILVLRSAKDLYGLLALLRMPRSSSSRIRCIGYYVRTIAIFYQFGDYFWCHDLQRLQTSGVRKDFYLRVHINGQAPSVYIRGKHYTVRHPLFHTTPKPTPFRRQLWHRIDLILDCILFCDGAGLFNLIRDISSCGLLPCSVHCQTIHWTDKLNLPKPASLHPKFPLNRHFYIKSFELAIKDCTDNLLVSFATHYSIGRHGRGVVMLNQSEVHRLLTMFSVWAGLAREAGLERQDITSQVFLPGESLGREGVNPLSEVDQDVAGCCWRIHSQYDIYGGPLRSDDFSYEVELGCHMRQDPGSAQTAHISSIAIVLYHARGKSNWDAMLNKALAFPLLDTLKVCIYGLYTLRDFVARHYKTLAVAKSQGRLRLYFSDVKALASQEKHWRQVDLLSKEQGYVSEDNT